MFLLQGRFQHGFVPEHFARPSVKAEQYPVLPIEAGAYREDAVTPHNRRSVAAPGNPGGPDDVAGRTPLNGCVGFQAGAVAARSAPAGPVLSQGRGQCGDHKKAAQKVAAYATRSLRGSIEHNHIATVTPGII